MMDPTPETVDRCQTILAHAWMVRTFIKHCPEVEEFPELMLAAREIFDLCRSVESRVGDPAAYVHQLRKKFSKLKAGAQEFTRDAPLASDHTNFRQAVISLNGCVEQLKGILDSVPPPPRALPSVAAVVPISHSDTITPPFGDDSGMGLMDFDGE
jgi:hypothetical protein